MKTNHKISAMQAALSVLCGVVLAVHRSGQTATGAAMVLVGAAALIVLALCGLRVHHLRKKLLLKSAEPDKLGFAMLTLSGFLSILAAVFFFLRNTASLLGIITALFCCFCGITTILRLSLRDSGKTAAVYSLVPIFFLSFFLLMFYRSNGDNPADWRIVRQTGQAEDFYLRWLYPLGYFHLEFCVDPYGCDPCPVPCGCFCRFRGCEPCDYHGLHHDVLRLHRQRCLLHRVAD